MFSLLAVESLLKVGNGYTAGRLAYLIDRISYISPHDCYPAGKKTL